MADINLSKAVRSNLLSLQGTSALMGKTQERLSSGNKVNSALDNPTNFFTAAALNSRSSDLNQLMDSVGNAVQTIAAADKGIKAITKLVEAAQSTARQALQTAETVVTTAGVAAIPATVTGGSFGTTTAAAFTVNSTSITLTAGEGMGSVIDKINAQTATTGVSAVDDGGKIKLNGKADGTSIVIGGTVTGTGLTAATTAGTTAVTEVTGANPKRAELLEQYNDILTQIDQLAKDSGFNGVNLLEDDNDLQVIFNEDGSSNLNVESKDTNAAGLGLDQITVTTTWNTKAGINGTLNDLKSAVEDLRVQSSKFGSNLSVVENRRDFTKDMINVLQTGAANLTLADTNEEAANLLALQTRQSLSTTSLSMASQADQNVLQLLR